MAQLTPKNFEEEQDSIFRLYRIGMITADEGIKAIERERETHRTLAEQYYKMLCRLLNGDEGKTNQGILSVSGIAVYTYLSEEAAQKVADDMVHFGITEKQGGGYVI